MEHETLKYSTRPHLAFITLDRPRASNRVNLTMAIELKQVCQRLRQDEGVRVGILTGRGRAFSVGRERLDSPRDAGNGYAPDQWLELHRAASALAEVEIPLIAAINGDAIDHGLELALACDIRIAAGSARIGVTDLSKGVVPWDGATQRLPRLVGRARALEMLLTSRLMQAEEACRAGLVTMVMDPADLLKGAEKLALDVASSAPIAARYAKEAVLKGHEMTLEQGLRLEADLNLVLQSTSDREEGIRSFLEKRAPTFRGQ